MKMNAALEAVLTAVSYDAEFYRGYCHAHQFDALEQVRGEWFGVTDGRRTLLVDASEAYVRGVAARGVWVCRDFERRLLKGDV
jgi:hypothetical protein